MTQPSSTRAATESRDASGFLPALESLRGIAALTVALYHLTWVTHLRSWRWPGNGYLMVDFFFILSGFVIAHSYGERLRSAADIRRFLILRIGRVYPLHLVMLIFFLFVKVVRGLAIQAHLLTPPATPFRLNTPASFVANLFLVHAFGLFPVQTWNTPSWSISVEFWIYVLFAALSLACWSLLREGASRTPPWTAVVCLLAGLALSISLEGALTATARFGFYRGLLGFFSGVVVRYLYGKLRTKSLNLSIISTGLALLLAAVVVFLSIKQPGISDFFCVPLFAAIVLLAALSGAQAPRFLRSQPALGIGKISYSIYMLNAAVVFGFEFVLQFVPKVPRGVQYEVNPWAGDLLGLLYLGIVVVSAGLSYRYIEDPGRRLSKRLIHS